METVDNTSNRVAILTNEQADQIAAVLSMDSSEIESIEVKFAKPAEMIIAEALAKAGVDNPSEAA